MPDLTPEALAELERLEREATAAPLAVTIAARNALPALLAAARKAGELEEERLLLARLAKCQEEPQFFNPIHAAAAIELRDRVLAAAALKERT